MYREGYLHRHFLFGLVEFHAALWFEHPYVGQGGEVSALEPPTLCQSPQMLENWSHHDRACIFWNTQAYLIWAKSSASESFSSSDAFIFSLTDNIFVRTWLEGKEIWVLNIVMISFPCPIWAANSFPCWNACFFASYISTDVLWKISISAFVSLTNFNGEFSTKNLRKCGVPRRAMIGRRMLCWKAVGAAIDLWSLVRIRVYVVNKCTNVSCLDANT